MSLLKLQAPCKDYIWGGQRLINEYNKHSETGVAAESWELSCNKESPSIIVNGRYAGRTLPDYIDEKGKEAVGKNSEGLSDFPLLVKLIDAREALSVQVHPDDEYASEHEKSFGKTEMWYVLDAEEDSFIYYGLNRQITEDELKRRIEDMTISDVLNAVPVSKGDVVFIEAGTLHAIGKGILIAEIQQNSCLTYRVYDYGRKDKNGKFRELNINDAINVIKRQPVKKVKDMYPHLASCKYFTVDKLHLSGDYLEKISGYVDERSFMHILFLDGEGRIASGEDNLHFRKGDSFFLPASSGDYDISGKCEALITTI